MKARYLGVDFSGAKQPEGKIWVAEVAPEPKGPKLVSLRNGFSWKGLVDHLLAVEGASRQGCALIDFPFGLAAPTAENLGVGSREPDALWQAVAACGTPEAFSQQGRGGASGGGSERAHKRHVDRLCQTPFAAINLWLYRQTFRGMTEVLLPLSKSGASIAPWSLGDFWIGESCPSSVLRSLTGVRPTGYKRNTKRPDPLGERARRKHFLDLVRKHFRVRVPKCRRFQILDDPEGDALDAFVLAAAAAAVSEAEIAKSRAHIELHPTEAWVYLGRTGDSSG